MRAAGDYPRTCAALRRAKVGVPPVTAKLAKGVQL
jgi:hypothetical protein